MEFITPEQQNQGITSSRKEKTPKSCSFSVASLLIPACFKVTARAVSRIRRTRGLGDGNRLPVDLGIAAQAKRRTGSRVEPCRPDAIRCERRHHGARGRYVCVRACADAARRRWRQHHRPGCISLHHRLRGRAAGSDVRCLDSGQSDFTKRCGHRTGSADHPDGALKAITINAAYQYAEEKFKGSLEVGKLADLVILDKNPLKVEPMTIKDIKVVETIKEGKTIYKAK